MKIQPLSVSRYHDKLVRAKQRKPLSVAMSAVMRIITAQSQAIDESDALWAPSECYDILRRSYEARLDTVAKQHGFLNYAILRDVIARRTSARWVHHNLPPSVY